jgi:Tol biopolymer transport system component
MAGRIVICLTGIAAGTLIAAGAGSGRPGIVSADQQVYTVPAAGGHARQVTQGDLAAHSPSWSPDGARLAYVQGSRIVVRSLGSGTTRSIVSGLVSNDPPAWSPDGRRIAFTGLTLPEGVARISVVASTGSKPKVVASTPWGTGDDQRGPVWSPDGKLLAFCLQGPLQGKPGGVLASGDLDLAVVTLTGARTKLTAAKGNEADPRWSPDGRSILYSTAAALRIVPRGGGPSRPVARLSSVWGASWSLDGKLIAFTGSRPGESRAHLYVVRPDGGGLRRLTGEVTPDAPTWAPNGKAIAFGTYKPGIDAVAPDGSRRHTIVAIPDADIGHLAWSPNGRTIAFDARKQPPES